MKQYLIDTNICIFHIKGKYALIERFKKVGRQNLFVSEISVAELKFGVENSQHVEKNRKVLKTFLSSVKILPIFQALDIYAMEKARLRKRGTPIEDFDLLIGSTGVSYELTVVTNNINHFNRIKGIELEDWTQES